MKSAQSGKLLLSHEELRVLAKAIFGLAEKRCGALFIFERRDLLEPLLRSPGTVVNAEVSSELLETLFTPPRHTIEVMSTREDNTESM